MGRLPISEGSDTGMNETYALFERRLEFETRKNTLFTRFLFDDSGRRFSEQCAAL